MAWLKKSNRRLNVFIIRIISIPLGDELKCLIELENQRNEHSKYSFLFNSKRSSQAMKIIGHILVELSLVIAKIDDRHRGSPVGT